MGFVGEASFIYHVQIPNTVTVNTLFGPQEFVVTEIVDSAFARDTYINQITLGDSLRVIGRKAFAASQITNLTIPNKVLQIRDGAFQNCRQLTTLKIGDSVNLIQDNAFKNCSALRTVSSFGIALQTIGASAFENCTSLQSVSNIPARVQTIGNYAFKNCRALTDIKLSVMDRVLGSNVTGIYPTELVSIGTSAFEGCGFNTTIHIPKNVQTIGDKAFHNCSNMSGVTFSNTLAVLTTIGNHAFSNTKINSVNIPHTVTTIGASAFANCSQLATATIGKNVISIGDSAFFTCANLTRVTARDNQPLALQKVGRIAFKNCRKLTKVDLGNVLTTIEYDAFHSCPSLRDIVLPNSLQTIASGAFAGDTSLTSINISNNITIINGYTFYQCKGLTYVTLPNSVVTIQNNAFEDCTELKNIVMGESVTFIGARAFQNCGKLTAVALPNSLQTINEGAFAKCVSLGTIVFPDNVVTIGAKAFENCTGLTQVIIGKGVATIGAGAFMNCYNISTMILDSQNTHFDSRQNSNAIIETSTNKLIYGTHNTTIPQTVTSIGGGAFAGNRQLQTIDIPNSITSIEAEAFKDCIALANVKIGNAVQTIGQKAFMGCTLLTSVVIPNGVVTIDQDAFNGCSGITRLFFGNKLKTICEGAFKNCTGLTEVTFPKSVDWIKFSAFEGASNIKIITFLDDVYSRSSMLSVDGCLGNIVDTIYVPGLQFERYHGDFGRSNDSKIKSLGNVSLKVGQWNFISGAANKNVKHWATNIVISPSEEAMYYPFYTTDKTDLLTTDYNNCNYVALEYDYTINNWKTNYMTPYETLTEGAGYFVWPFNENVKGTQITTDDSTIWMHRYLKTTGEFTYTTTSNNGHNATPGVGTGYWFALANALDEKVTYFLNNGNTENITINGAGIQGNKMYVYRNKAWQALNSGQDINPGEGIMVAAPVAGKTATIKAKHSIPNWHPMSLPQQESVQTTEENEGIKFTFTANGQTSHLYAKQMTDAEDGFEINDAYILFSLDEEQIEPYFLVDNNAIQYNRYNSDSYSCAVNFHARTIGGLGRLSVSDVPEGTTVSIVDLENNNETVLEDNVFEFDVQVGENSDRYLIKIVKNNSSLNTAAQNEANISIWNNNKEIFVKGEKLQKVEIYNTVGQKVYQREISGDAYNFTFDNKGAYIIKATSENGIKSQKVVIK